MSNKVVDIVRFAPSSSKSSRRFDATVSPPQGSSGGSHGLHDKGGALYDEALNTPLYISYPGMRNNYTAGNETSVSRAFLCSSVDLLAFFYETALGNGSWRDYPFVGETADPYSYLKTRESIFDAVYGGGAATQRRVTNIPNSANTGYLPYVLHTTDEYLTLASQTSQIMRLRFGQWTLP